MPDIITQAELRAVWNTWNNFGNTILNIRKRNEAGVPFEPGFIKAESDRRSNPIEDNVDDDGLVMAHAGFDMFGLDITLGDEAAEPAEDLKSARPETSEPALPEWLDTGIDGYELSWWPSQSSCPQLQGIELTRSEFIALKHYLAELRGYTVPAEAAHA
jgi:hypothetical protein